MFKIQPRDDIDGLRALSVLSVIAYHASIPAFKGGFVGVDIFFVISGYLITSILCNELLSKGTINLAAFYSKRIRRLFPAMATVIIATTLVWAFLFLGVPKETHDFAQSIKYSLLGLANFHFSQHSGGYFDSASDEMPLLHLWSLAVEEQFYLIWPFLLLFAVRKTKTSEKESQIFKVISACTLISFIASIYFVHVHKELRSTAFYWMPLRAWELGIGGLLAFILAKKESFLKNLHFNSQKLVNIAASVGLLLILFSIFIYSAHNPFPGPNALFPVVGAVLLLLTEESYIATFFRKTWVVKIGKISYGWYLWHWPMLALGKLWFLATPPLEFRISVVLLSALLAWLSYTFIETPIRFSKSFNHYSPRQVFLYMVFFCFTIYGSTQALVRYESHKLSQHKNSELYKKLESSLQDHEKQIKKLSACMDNIEDASCKISTGPTNETLIWGDSHALSYVPLFEKLAQEYNFSLTLFSRGLTPPLLDTQGAEAIQFNNEVLEKIQKSILKAPAKKHNVILASYWSFYLGKGGVFLDKKKSTTTSLEILSSALNKTLSQLKQMGVSKVLILLPYPSFEHITARCLYRKPDLCGRSRADIKTEYTQVTQAIRRVSSNYNFVSLSDPIPTLCNETECPQIITKDSHAFPVVSDNNHPSKEAALFLYEKSKAELLWLLE